MEVIFYAPLGRGIEKYKVGGAEMGCRRTLGIYEDAGFKVYCVEKDVNLGSRWRYALSFARTYASLVAKMLAHPRAVVHIVGFYDKIIDIELLLVRTAHALGRKVVYEIRNGSMIEVYDKRDDAYRHKQLEIFRLADGVLCQGECFVDFIKEKLGRDSFYYPNFIDDEFISTLKPRNIDGEIRLVYFGRVAPSKNVDQVIRATALLRRSYPGARLDIIGGVDPEYKTLLDRAVEESGLPADAIRYHGPQSLEYIVGVLQAAHFFVFPTAYEGHSNALTEAMACGAVPVASDVGFNASIIGDKSLVIDSLDAKDYAERMAEILQSGQINTLSASVQNRIISHYTRSLVAPRLTAYIRSMEK